jgi:hypothetical protein
MERIYDYKVRKVLRRHLKISHVGTRRRQVAEGASTTDSVPKLG